MNARILVGMTMGARRRRLWNEFFDEAWDGATIDDFRAESAKYRLGQRLRPCPGCEQCTDSPRLQVMGYARRIGGSVKMSRIYIHWRQRSEYSLSIDCTGSVLVAGGVTKDEAWNAMRGYMREQNQINAPCDGSGVLPAKKAKAKR